MMYLQTENIVKTCVSLFGKDYKYSVSSHFDVKLCIIVSIGQFITIH